MSHKKSLEFNGMIQILKSIFLGGIAFFSLILYGLGILKPLEILIIIIGLVVVHYAPKLRKKKKSYDQTGLRTSQIETLKNQLETYLENEKPYLNETLCRASLSGALGITPNNLSQVLSQSLNTNFYDLLNRYRVEEVKKRLVDPRYENYKIIAIAYDCGFSSKAVFNKVFKKITNTNPSDYKKQAIRN